MINNDNHDQYYYDYLVSVLRSQKIDEEKI